MSDNTKWYNHFLHMAYHHSRISKDPNTQVGAVIVGEDWEVLSMGFNGFPRGIKDDARLQDKPTKLKMIVHAEQNAILCAARRGVRLKGSTLFLCATDHTGAIWGGPPCTHCTVQIIQAGIVKVVSRPPKPEPSSWHDDLKFAGGLLKEAGVCYWEEPYAP